MSLELITCRITPSGWLSFQCETHYPRQPVLGGTNSALRLSLATLNGANRHLSSALRATASPRPTSTVPVCRVHSVRAIRLQLPALVSPATVNLQSKDTRTTRKNSSDAPMRNAPRRAQSLVLDTCSVRPSNLPAKIVVTGLALWWPPATVSRVTRNGGATTPNL